MAETRYIEGQDRYELAEMVGRGGFATVWRARPAAGVLGRGRDVAIKIIPIYSESERSRAMREGQIAEGLHHRNIVETIEVIPGDYEVYLVTEYVHGLPLNEAAQVYDVDEIVDALAQILEALSYAHGQGIIHRDIKPQNALVDRRGRVKLTDFGVAYRPGDTRLTQVGFAVGTPGYIAPEIMDDADPSELSDIYAVGATARTLLAHQPDELPPRLREFVDRATSPNPAHRPRGARAALKLLTGQRGRSADTVMDQTPDKVSRRLSGHLLRAANGAAAGWLGYLLGAQILQRDGAETIGIAAGVGVLGYLLPRIAALGLVVALAVALLKNGVGLGFAVLAPAIGGTWVLVGGATSGSVSKLPLGPVLGVPLAAVGLGAGLPLLFGALMRPLGAAFSAAAGALFLVGYDLAAGDTRIPYSGVPFDPIPAYLTIPGLVDWTRDIVEYVQQDHPSFPFLFVLWAAMAGALSLGEWAGRWVVGLLVAVGGGMLGYFLAVSETANALNQALISLGFAAIMYGIVRYFGSRVRG
ncbi:MAG: protein kinase domain-containing protein [Rubrobacteraceae bacterium]